MSELLGILSDTHGRVATARAAVDLLLERGATRLVHLGDVGDDSVLDLLAGVPATVCFGNCDDERPLARYADAIGIEVGHPSAILEVRGMRVGLTHGHLEDALADLLDQRPDYILHGHTHEPRDDAVDGVRVLNPGALHRAARFTAMLLEPRGGRATWLDVSTGETVAVTPSNRAP
ncbi:MAG: hypothetical protein RIS86_147 [Planctomycetota bacterium]|jgi:putative phosphoesterase